MEPSRLNPAALVARVGLPIGPEAGRDLKTRHRAKVPSPGLARRGTTRQAFRRLAPLGLPTAVVSNAPRSEVHLALAAAGLAPPVAVAIRRDDVSRGRPDPEGYLAAARDPGVPPSDCLLAGCKAGPAAGMLTVFHPRHSAASPEGAAHPLPEDRLIDLNQPWPAPSRASRAH